MSKATVAVASRASAVAEDTPTAKSKRRRTTKKKAAEPEVSEDADVR